MDRVEKALHQINRSDFVLPELAPKYHLDTPLSIGHGQTISQPTTVKEMLYWLDARPGHKVMDVGSGSGWTTALLSNIIGKDGRVFAVERIPELLDFGQANCIKSGVSNAEFHLASAGVYGLPHLAPFDRVLVSASAEKLPSELLDQLKIGGKIIIPVRHDILEITKTSASNRTTVVHPGFIFVPLVLP